MKTGLHVLTVWRLCTSDGDISPHMPNTVILCMNSWVDSESVLTECGVLAFAVGEQAR